VRDLYEIIGVAKDASDEDIKRAYRRKARELHPDAGGDEEHFKELTTAYEVLKNPQTRSNYDRFGDPRGPGGAGGGAGFSDFGDLGDLIETFFGGFGGGGTRGGRATRQGGRDAIVDVTLTLEEAAAGVRRDIDVTVDKLCGTCDGSGARPGSSATTCAQCQGAGAVQQVQRSVFGQMLTTVTCPVCRGAGEQITDPCPDCRGEGRRQVTEVVTVDVPAGVDDGRRLRLTGRGEAGRRGAPAGDLYVRIRVAPHAVFERDGHDLHCELRVPFTQATLGAELKISTLDGEEVVKVPRGAQTGDVITLRRQGMPRLNGGGARGHLYAHCRVETPTDLDAEQERLLREFAELRGEDTREPGAQRGLLGRLREVFGA
jgi:molecular chaperone DnaJ